MPVATAVPPVGKLYQFRVPILDAALSVNIPVPQRLAGVVDETLGIAFIVAVIGVLIAEIQVPFTPST